MITGAIRRLIQTKNCEGKNVLNLGSGGNDYGMPVRNHFHLDIAEARLPRHGCAVVASAELIPFKPTFFDLVVCVGSVLNYCDVVGTCREIARVLKPGGELLLEFESSQSGEFLWRHEFGRAAVVANLMYQDQPESIWLYSPAYVTNVLDSVGLPVYREEGFHTITSLAYRAKADEHFAARFGSIEQLPFISRLLRRFAANRILISRKRS
jgi:SAM-dependent methyltransferase